MTNCEKIQEMISCLIDGELSENEKAEVESHIAVCPECRVMYEDFAALGDMMSAETADVPAALHNDIMEAVKSAPKAKKKKGLLVSLRPYMGAAACLAIIVGLVAMMGTGRGFDSASAAPASAPASAPACEADSYVTAECPAEYGLEDTVECEEPEAPPAEAEEQADVSLSTGASESCYVPGEPIDEAILTTIMTDGSRESIPLTELDKLAEALLPTDFTDSYGAEAPASAELSICCGSQWYTLELCYAGEALIVRQAGNHYFAAATVQEFLEIK